MSVHALAKPTASEEDRQAMLGFLEEARALVETGEISTLVLVTIKHDRTFRCRKTGDMTRIETVGYLAQAQFDLLAAE